MTKYTLVYTIEEDGKTTHRTEMMSHSVLCESGVHVGVKEKGSHTTFCYTNDELNDLFDIIKKELQSK